MTETTQPNILFIQADQMTAFALSQYGNPVVKMPNVDRLADSGVVFENAYCNNPVCAPSRFSMMTGRLALKIGAYDNASEFPASLPTFAHYLNDLGYQTCLSGKMHFVGPDQLHGFHERVTTDIYPADFGWGLNWEKDGAQLTNSRMSLSSVVDAGVSARSLQIDYDEEVCHQAEAKLWEYARQDNPQPFFLAASFTQPHNPYTTQQEYWDLYDPDEINMPTVPSIPLEERDPWSQRYHAVIRADEHDISEDDIRNSRHAYYGMCSYIDHQVGRLLKVLDDGGLTDNTVVIFTADHGDMIGERGMWYKFNPYEWSVRVPLIISAPGFQQGKSEASLVSLVDLLPTFMDLASNNNPPDMIDPIDGNSLLPLLSGQSSDWQNEVMIEYSSNGMTAPAMILRRGAYKYVYCETDPGMLFDLENDPNELENLCEHPEHATLSAEMLDEILARWDPVAIREDIIVSQKRRALIQKTLLAEKTPPWDYQPSIDTSTQFIRSGNSAAKVKALSRYPVVESRPKDHPREA